MGRTRRLFSAVLGALDEVHAREVLAHHVDPGRLSAEPHAVARLMAVCAGWPLALRIVAARAADHPDFPLTLLADELSEESARLDGLDAGEPYANLPAVLLWSYRTLNPRAMTVLGLLGLAPGPDISLPAAAAVAEFTIPQARIVLRDLENLSLLQQHAPSRYRMHDLVRLHASQQASHALSAATRRTALRRLTNFYLQTAQLGNRLITQSVEQVGIDSPAVDCRPHPLTDAGEAMQWFADEHRCLLAAQQAAATQRWHMTVWQLAYALDEFHSRRGYLRDSILCWRVALAAARQLGDPATAGLAAGLLGRAHARIGRHVEAIDLLNHALAVAESMQDIRRQARTHVVLTVSWHGQGDAHRALIHASRSLDLFRALDDAVGQARALGNLG